MITQQAPSPTQSNKWQINFNSVKCAVLFVLPCEYGGFIKPMVKPFLYISSDFCFKKSAQIRLLFPSPRNIMLVVAIENISSRNSIP